MKSFISNYRPKHAAKRLPRKRKGPSLEDKVAALGFTMEEYAAFEAEEQDASQQQIKQ